ncbi:hypothetical protein BGZ63DRAFT_421231 [Mariannaea sp. PMI_226]|nr:hypothetical protein BGZ63DRAFT_421231 [Mariannaea sp. PMI_226]
MNLTPIRIRGKRKTRSTITASNPPSALVASSELLLHPRFKQMKRSLSTVIAERSIRHRASLDSLPAEILEKILLYSTNLALPRAGPYIGAKLSGRATLLRLFIWAFHDTWNQWFGIPIRNGVYFGPRVSDSELQACDGDPVFQTAILELPWVTIDFILQAQQTWADKYAKDRWYEHSLHWEMKASDQPVLRLPDDHDLDGGFCHFDAQQCFEADYQQALTWKPFQSWRKTWGFRDLHPQCRIPTSLITGPWNEEQRRRLFWLTRGGAFNLQGPDRSDSESLYPWEVRVEFLRTAVIEAPEPNILVFECLMHHWMFPGIPREVIQEELKKLQRRIEWGGDSENSRSILRDVATTLRFILNYTAIER